MLELIDIEVIIQAFIKQVQKEKGYLLIIISDRNTQFILYFQKRLYNCLGTKLKLLIIFYPKTDD